MLSLNVRTPVHENNHTSHRVQDPSLIRISQHTVTLEGKEKGGLKAKRSWLVRVESRRYASNFCKAAQTS